MSSLSRSDRATGAVMGALIGDALGLGCHWYYDVAAMREDCGDWIADYRDSDSARKDRFGYIARLALIFLAVFLVRDASWISMPAVGMSIIVTHLGLLVWELKYVAISLAFSGLKPRRS